MHRLFLSRWSPERWVRYLGAIVRRCCFPLELGLRLEKPCRLQEVVVFSEPGLAPSAVECFVAGPARPGRAGAGGKDLSLSSALFPDDNFRHNGSTKVTHAGRTRSHGAPWNDIPSQDRVRRHAPAESVSDTEKTNRLDQPSRRKLSENACDTSFGAGTLFFVACCCQSTLAHRPMECGMSKRLSQQTVSCPTLWQAQDLASLTMLLCWNNIVY